MHLIVYLFNGLFITSLGDEERAVVNRVKELFSKINEMKSQRAALYTHLREQVLTDDITKNIVTRSSDDTQVSLLPPYNCYISWQCEVFMLWLKPCLHPLTHYFSKTQLKRLTAIKHIYSIGTAGCTNAHDEIGLGIISV